MKVFFLTIVICLTFAAGSFGQTQRILTLEESINIALNQSFDAARIEQSLINAQMSLQAAQSSLKSNSELFLNSFPNFQDNERRTAQTGGTFSFDRQRFLEFQADWFINQPVRFTDGVFSLVGSFQRFQQFGTFERVGFDQNGMPLLTSVEDPTDYAPQLRLQFRQPLFTLNRLNTNFTKSELNLKRTQYS